MERGGEDGGWWEQLYTKNSVPLHDCRRVGVEGMGRSESGPKPVSPPPHPVITLPVPAQTNDRYTAQGDWSQAAQSTSTVKK